MARFLTSQMQLLIIFSARSWAVKNSCEPEFTDNCFMDVQRDLNKMIDTRNGVLLNGTRAAVDDLCVSLWDGLNCCSDIVDSDCQQDYRKENIEAWIWAFKATFNQACAKNRDDLQGILASTACWNLESFLECVIQEANLTRVEDLFFIHLQDKDECQILEVTFEDCTKNALLSSCREQDDTTEIRQRFLRVFLDSAQCGAAFQNSVVFCTPSVWLSIATALLLIKFQQ